MSTKTLFSKSTVLATIVTLAVASISATSVFAATPARPETAHQRAADVVLQSDWKAETLSLRTEKFQNSLIQKWILLWLKDNPNASDRVRVENDLHKADVLMLQADATVSKHAGFSASGTVLDSLIANKTLLQLSTDLHALHTVLITNLDSFLQ